MNASARRRGAALRLACPPGFPLRPARSRGFGYIWVLIVVALLGTLLASAGTVWETAGRREREKELLFAGDQIRAAIGAWYESSPGADKRFPPTLEHLLRDPRYPTTRRYLRRVYADPMTEDGQWAFVRAPDGGIAGVYSQSERAPIKTGGFKPADEGFEGAGRYADWKFIYAGGAAEGQEGGGAAAGPGTAGTTPAAPAGSPAFGTAVPAAPSVPAVPMLQPALIPTAPVAGTSPPATPPTAGEKPETPKSNPDCESQRLAFVQRCVAAAKGKPAIERACEATSLSHLQLCVRFSGG